MRSIKELLQVMLQHKDLFEKGMCHWVGTLHQKDIITESEAETLSEYIRYNRLNYFSWSNFIRGHEPGAYYFPKGKIKPRIYWIKRHIKKNS
jgi:hypothetical protein